MSAPLADKIRPKTLADVVGQEHILAEGKPLRRIIESGSVPNMIFYGPSGVGKTTVARIIAENCGMTLYKLNGTNASLSDIKDVVADIGTFGTENGILLYLDEIQYLNKKQQQSLLEYIENGDITLIASTTENPYFAVYNAVISRSTVFEFKPVTAQQLAPAIKRAFRIISEERQISVAADDEIINKIAYSCGGDVRKAINTAELAVMCGEIGDGTITVTTESLEILAQRSNMRYDRDGDQHYDILSAFHKSVRGSDENAALHYAARLIAVQTYAVHSFRRRRTRLPYGNCGDEGLCGLRIAARTPRSKDSSCRSNHSSCDSSEIQQCRSCYRRRYSRCKKL